MYEFPQYGNTCTLSVMKHPFMLFGKCFVLNKIEIHCSFQVLPSSSVDLCKGLLFQAESSCGKPFPTFPICDESRVGTTISSCSDTTIIMNANRKHAIRFWLSYYGKRACTSSFTFLFSWFYRLHCNLISRYAVGLKHFSRKAFLISSHNIYFVGM